MTDDVPDLDSAEPKAPRPKQPRADLPPGERALEAAILSHVIARGPDKSICPSEVAQGLGPDWRSKLSAVRRAAIRLAQAGHIDILRKGARVAPEGVKGVIRLRVRSPDTAAGEPDPSA